MFMRMENTTHTYRNTTNPTASIRFTTDGDAIDFVIMGIDDDLVSDDDLYAMATGEGADGWTLETTEPWKVVSAMERIPGLTEAQALTVTGKGQRRNPGCKPEDTIANKLAAGALSPLGVATILNL